MMLTIHGLPRYVKYQDLKVLVKEECNISDFFFDNLVDESETTKKVRIALALEKDGVHLYNCLDGFQMAGHVLKVVSGHQPMNSQNTQGNTYPQRRDYPSNVPSTNRPTGRPDLMPNPMRGPSGPLGSSNAMQGRPDVMRGHAGSMGGPDVMQARANPNRVMSDTLGRPEPMQGRLGFSGRSDAIQSQPGIACLDPMQSQMSMAGQADRWNQGNTQWSNQATLSQPNSYSHHSASQGNASFVQQPKWQSPVQDGGYRLDLSESQLRGESRAHVLRSVEVIDEPLNRSIEIPSVARPSVAAMTISKDNFQGPQLGLDRELSFQLNSPWAHTNPLDKQPYAKPSSSFERPGYDRKYPDPAGDKRPKDDPMHYNKGPRFSPRRDILMPPTRRDSPGRRASPNRRPSPIRRSSPIPSDRRRADSPRMRYGSPHRDKSRDKYPPLKDVRPAYDGPSQAPNQAMYPGGYRPSLHENVTYPVPGTSRESPWQDRSAFATKEEDRRDSRPKFDREDPKRSPHASRSPVHRSRPLERSPPRDRYVKRSVSPRSPRRSWALEKRRSPDEAPPPPLWPGQTQDNGGKRNFSGDDKKLGPVWERPPFHDKAEHERGPAIPDKRFGGGNDVRSDLGRGGITEHPRSLNRDTSTRGKPDDRMPQRQPVFELREPQFESRKESKFETRREPQFEPRREPQFEPRRDPKFELRETREPNFEPRQPALEPRKDPKFETKGPKFEPRRDPNFGPSDPKFGPKFEPPLQPKFDPRGPTFEPRRDLKFDPKFEPRNVRDPQLESRGPNFDSRELKLPRFEPRTDFEDSVRREKMSRLYLENRHEKEASDRDGRDVRPPAFRRDELERREQEGKLPKPTDFNKEFDDVYKRSLEFKFKVEQIRRIAERERRKEGIDDRRSDDRRPEPKRSDDRRPEDRKPERDGRRMDDDRHTTHEDRRPEARKEPQPGGWAARTSHWTGEMKAKREKAIEEICKKLMQKYGSHLVQDQHRRVYEEMKKTVTNIFSNMFEDRDISFIEMVLKFNARHEGKAEVKLFEDVMSVFPTSYRKRPGQDVRHEPEAPAAKSARMSSDHNLTRDVNRREEHVPDWSAKMDPQQVSLLMQQFDIVPQVMLHPAMSMVPALNSAVPIVSQMSMQHNMLPQVAVSASMPPQATMVPQPTFILNDIDRSSPVEEIADESFYLYLCKDDFEPYTSTQAEYLKKYLVNHIISASESATGWTPDFTLKGLQSLYRYELVARDDATRDWIMNLDFSDFSFFNVLVYTKEELWYERAAIWLPGHSKARNIEPLVKLKLQNRYIEGVNIGKWKLVKKIVNAKGTRLYVEMPPSSARALEKHKMELSYELQKVSVFLKAVAVDKDAFDVGLKDISVTDDNVILNAIQVSPMPSIGSDTSVVKFALKGNKPLNLVQARKIKEMIIYRIFKYIQDKGTRKTDFVKFGFCLPGYFAVLPENSESRRWLESLNLGKLNKHAIVVLGAEHSNTKMIRMSVIVRRNSDGLNGPLILERLKLSNQGVKGLHLNLWKVVRVYATRDNKLSLEVDMDVDSIDVLSKMSYRLDYVDSSQLGKSQTATVRYDRSYAKLEELVRKYRSEQSDSYDVANMELASDHESENDDIICMGELK